MSRKFYDSTTAGQKRTLRYEKIIRLFDDVF